MTGKLFLIRKRGYFYRPNEQGYTANIAEAGRYPEAQAVAIMESCDPGDINIQEVPESPLVDIPPDVQTAAMKCCYDMIGGDGHVAIALAILAERKRCADYLLLCGDHGDAAKADSIMRGDA